MVGRELCRVGVLVPLVLAALGASQPTDGRRTPGGAPQERAIVIAVHDGDTVSIRGGDGQMRRVRVEGIDAPELNQRFGLAARDVMRALTLRKSVQVVSRGRDRYGRTLARILVDGQDASELLVQRGLAWHFIAYSDDRRLDALERLARRNHVGLWRDGAPTPPWNFRSASSVTTATAVTGPLHGNERSHVVHAPACPDYDCANCTRAFSALREAVAAGYRAHRQCLSNDRVRP